MLLDFLLVFGSESTMWFGIISQLSASPSLDSAKEQSGDTLIIHQNKKLFRMGSSPSPQKNAHLTYTLHVNSRNRLVLKTLDEPPVTGGEGGIQMLTLEYFQSISSICFYNISKIFPYYVNPIFPQSSYSSSNSIYTWGQYSEQCTEQHSYKKNPFY